MARLPVVGHATKHRVVVSALAQRKAEHYVLNVIVLLAALTSMGFTTFLLDSGGLGDMCGITITLILTQVTRRA